MSNSPLVSLTMPSPNYTKGRTYQGKTYDIDTVTIHCTAVQVTARRGGEIFQDPAREASCHYVVGLDGLITQCVDEADRSWCTGGLDKNGNPILVNGISGKMNDYRAITIEVSSDNKHPYVVNEKAMAALLDLLTDICRRNPGIGRLRWKGDKSLVGNVAQQNMTVHRWFANKACPGDYLYGKHAEIAAEVNRRLDEEDEQKEDKPVIYKHLSDIPSEDNRRIVSLLMQAGILAGYGEDGTGETVLDLSGDMVRIIAMNYRGGAYDRKLMAEGLPPAVAD